MKKMLILLFTVAVLVALSIKPPSVIYEQQLQTDYYDMLSIVQQLFREHLIGEGNLYYNPNYQTRAEVEELLKNHATKKGANLIIDELFIEVNSLLFYNDNLQEYLNERRDYYLYSSPIEKTYYSTVKETILNPALRMISFDYMNKEKSKDKLILNGDSVAVYFYEEAASDFETDYHQYARYGYPPSDRLSFTFSFLYKDGRYFLDGFLIGS